MSSTEVDADVPVAVLREDDGRIHLVPRVPDAIKIRGIGVFRPEAVLAGVEPGDDVEIGAKRFRVLPPRLPELRAGMRRRAQLITPKDAGFLIAWMGIGPGDRVLEAGLGSGGLAQQLLRVLGPTGTCVSIEPRREHAEVAEVNLARLATNVGDTGDHHLIMGELPDALDDAAAHSPEFDAIILDVPDHPPSVAACATRLAVGGRLACYAPVSSQMEAAWEACEGAGLEVEWAGELMERRWGRARLGGMRPVNGPMGHTAFLVIAQRL